MVLTIYFYALRKRTYKTNAPPAKKTYPQQPDTDCSTWNCQIRKFQKKLLACASYAPRTYRKIYPASGYQKTTFLVWKTYKKTPSVEGVLHWQAAFSHVNAFFAAPIFLPKMAFFLFASSALQKTLFVHKSA